MGHVIHNQKGLPQNSYSDVDIKKERQEAGFPAEGIGESELAKQWERASDEAVASHRIGDIQAAPAQMALRQQAAERLKTAKDALEKKAVDKFVKGGLNPEQAMRIVNNTSRLELARMVGDEHYQKAQDEYTPLNTAMLEVYNTLHANNPWIDKADPNARVHASFTGDLGFDHIIDILRQDLLEGRIKPEQLNKVSIEHAVRRTAEHDLEQTKKMRETQIKNTEGSIGKSRVTIPSHLFKLVYGPNQNHAWAYWIENSNEAQMSPPISYSELVAKTGIDFQLPIQTEQSQLKPTIAPKALPNQGLMGGWYPLFFDEYSTDKLNALIARIQEGKVASVQIQYDRNSELAKRIATQLESQTSLFVSPIQSSPPESTGVTYERNRVTVIVRSK